MNLNERKEHTGLKYYIHTFGCQMNENDSELVAGCLQSLNARPALSLEESNLIIINTCAVRQKTEEKLYSLLGRLGHIKKKNNAKIGVIGCMAQLYRAELLKAKPIIDFVVGPDNYRQIPQILAKDKKEKIVSTTWDSDWNKPSESHVIHKSRHSAFVTIMEGCNNFCSYCIVPFTRGREKFRPKTLILDEIKALSDLNYKEIILLGQNVNSYKDPDNRFGFVELLYEINRISGFEWLRFITSHPKNFTEEIVCAMNENKKICHSLHLPVQAGSTATLIRMKRRYTREEYLEKIMILRNLMPDISLSTDIIVGFPGETDEEYQETLNLLKEVRYTNIFSFRYSPRPQTSSSLEGDSVALDIKKKRLIDLQALQKNIQLEINRSFIGKIVKTLCLGHSKKDSTGYTGRNEGYQVINFDSDKNVIGQFVNVKITGCGSYSLHGHIIA